MAPLDKRERKNAAVFYFITAFLTIAWWILLILIPESRIPFLGQGFSEQFTWVLLSPDLISALAIAIFLGPYVLKNNPAASALAWLHAGGQGYAFCIAIGLAIIDPRAYWGVVGMAFSAGIAVFLAIRIQQLDILWGKFRFRPATSTDSKSHWRRTLVQTAIMWTIFLALIPLTIAFFEINLKFSQHWFTFTGQIPSAIIIFIVLGSIGLWSGYVMTHHGNGTPLPSEHATKLVILGPYRHIRNPMALCGTMQGTAVGLAIGSPLIFAYAILGALAWDILVRHLEEEDLSNRFGETYLEYRSKMRCWIPSLRPYLDQDKLQT